MDERLEQPGEQSGNEKMSQDEKKGKKISFTAVGGTSKNMAFF